MTSLLLLALAAATSASTTAASPGPAPPAQQTPPFTSLGATLKLDHDEGGEHMCPGAAQLTSFQANSAVDNAPVVVELLGQDHKPVSDKGWNVVAGLRVLPLVQGPLRITMICSTR